MRKQNPVAIAVMAAHQDRHEEAQEAAERAAAKAADASAREAAFQAEVAHARAHMEYQRHTNACARYNSGPRGCRGEGALTMVLTAEEASRASIDAQAYVDVAWSERARADALQEIARSWDIL